MATVIDSSVPLMVDGRFPDIWATIGQSCWESVLTIELPRSASKVSALPCPSFVHHIRDEIKEIAGRQLWLAPVILVHYY